MKTSISRLFLIVLGALAFGPASGWSQNQPVPAGAQITPPPSLGPAQPAGVGLPSPRPIRRMPAEAEEAPQRPVRFNLDFPGGTPGELIKLIEQSSKQPLNAIIPDDYVSITLPPLKMRDVTVPDLFSALIMASMKTVLVTNSSFGGNFQYSQYNVSYGFKSGTADPNSLPVWYFFYNGPQPRPGEGSACRFFNLTPFLDQGLKVEDITTAIKTGWTMLGATPVPELKFHKDTKLLIAVGEPSKLSLIESVLKELNAGISMTEILEAARKNAKKAESTVPPSLPKTPGRTPAE